MIMRISDSDILDLLGMGSPAPEKRLAQMPFMPGDLTAGSESELQVAVIGGRESVDLPQAIEGSSYYANVIRRIGAGEMPKRTAVNLDHYLRDNREGVWENSWVRFPQARLSPFAQRIFRHDLLADKRDQSSGPRGDRERFFCQQGDEQFIRIPISYLLKLSLAEAIGSTPDLPGVIFQTGERALKHFLNDNTSPETFSFYVAAPSPENGLGRVVAHEKSRRFLLTQLLAMYANRRFGLLDNGQRALVYFAPHPPVRQKRLNELISDAFYRELFMSPCLSGWDEGEAKHSYMHLCHQMLSRSQLNAVAKLREAGIVANNLIVLPNLSNISLANNGTHISLGSRRLTEARRAGALSAAAEKRFGDLTIKYVEHFLPLFVGTYSAAPYRLEFADFHPEQMLGFLPHELDYTHLRMLWRRWRGKADLKILGYPLTPLGPRWIDEPLGKLFRLRGDWVTDFRLLDYLVTLMSTESSPALDGTIGNGDRLKKDLATLGVFDERMSLYLLYRLREFEQMGFTGFEGRYYSLFESLRVDMVPAVNLQALITALAFKLQVEGRLAHEDLPDRPFIESERRQIFFAAAIGLPTFFVKRDTSNRVLQSILERCRKTRGSYRYAGYIRVKLDDFRLALLQTLREEGPDLIEMFGLAETLADLQQRLEAPREYSAGGKLLRGILGPRHRSPMRIDAAKFNAAAERYYREDLRRQYTREACDSLIEDWRRWERQETPGGEAMRAGLRHCARGESISTWLSAQRSSLLDETIGERDTLRLIHMVLLSLRYDAREYGALPAEPEPADNYAQSAYASIR